MTDRDTLEEDLDQEVAELALEPVGEWDWDPPLGSPILEQAAVWTEPSDPEDADGPDESDEEQDPEDIEERA